MASEIEALEHAFEAGGDVGSGAAGEYGSGYAWIERLSVHADYRRRGVARNLVEKAWRRLQRKGFEWLYTDAVPIGDPADAATMQHAQLIAFYEALGFEREGHIGSVYCRPVHPK